MRAMAAMILCLSAFVPLPFGFYAHGEPTGDPGISFSVPFICSNEGREGRCLADSFKSGLDVILVGENTTCSAKTGESFTDAEDFEATRLTGTDKCLAVTEKDQESFGTFRIGVLGSGPVTVRLVTPQVDGFSTPNDMESKARQLARFPIEKP